MEEQAQPKGGFANGSPIVHYCPSRWLMAHHDPQANIYTLSSHMCLADLNNEGENLLALVDFKPRLLNSANNKPPYDCRLRVYRGQQLIYNHFLDDVPSTMITTSTRAPLYNIKAAEQNANINEQQQDKHLLTLTINDDVYFYHKLKPSHKLSLEDDECILDTFNKSELDIWQMVRQNKVHVGVMKDLLIGLSNECGANELSSHSNNFLSLQTDEERKNYLLLWKFKRLNNGIGENLMSMDTICCSAARLRYNSNVTRSGDFGQTRESRNFLNNSKWNRILDIQRDGLILGTEDKHLLIYELRSTRASLECNYKLPSTPDNILVERRSPSNFELKTDVKAMTYKIIISCRNCRLYSIDQKYLSEKRPATEVRELVALKCNVLDMCWANDNEPNLLVDGINYPNFVVACLDRRVYCFSSLAGQCKWIVELESPITSIICLPMPSQSNMNESSLVGVASESDRIDFHVSSTGRIVDSIYFSDDHCQAMTFGRFGREDNCLCLATKLGHLMIFILKRSASFAQGQCLSSSASYASKVISESSHLLLKQQQQSEQQTRKRNQLKLDEPAALPSAFTLSKSSTVNPIDKTLDLLQSEHNCEQVFSKSTLDSQLQLLSPQLQIPPKGRDFVDQMVEQSRHSTAISKLFARHMLKLKDKIKSTVEQESDLRLDSNREDGNSVSVLKIIGLGNTYQVTLSLRFKLSHYVDTRHLLSGHNFQDDAAEDDEHEKSKVSVFLFLNRKQRNQCRIRPFRFELLNSTNQLAKKEWILEKTIEFKLLTGVKGITREAEQQQQQQQQSDQEESVSIEVYALLGAYFLSEQKQSEQTRPRRPVFISSVNIPTC